MAGRQVAGALIVRPHCRDRAAGDVVEADPGAGRDVLDRNVPRRPAHAHGAGIIARLSERSPAAGQGGRLEPRSEYPRPRLRRRAWQSLNGEWEFGAGPEPVFDRTILVPFCPESELSGVGERVGDVVWYRRSFEAPDGP